MILILSDGSMKCAEVADVLNKKGMKYTMFFTDFITAAKLGKGSVIIGSKQRRYLADAYVRYGITAVIDATSGIDRKLSRTALYACGNKVKFIRLVSLPNTYGAFVCRNFVSLAEKIDAINGNVAFFAASSTVSTIADVVLKKSREKMFVMRGRQGAFDIMSALDYNIPLMNIKETDANIGGFIAEINAKMAVCDETVDVYSVTKYCKMAGIPLLLTHSTGIDFLNVALTAEEAAEFVVG